MDKLILGVLSQDGMAGMLVAVCVLLSFNLLFGTLKFLWGMKREKDKLSENSVQKLTISMEGTTKAVEHLETQLKSLENAISEIPKFKIDLRRFYSAMKILAGEEWPRIRDEILQDTEF